MSVIPSSGSISLGTVQNEFGGTNPISLGEYYRNGAFVTPNNSGVAASGAISLGSFRGTYKTATVASIASTLYSSANISTVRNQLFSATSYANGMETSLASNFNSSSAATYRFATSVSYTRTWPTTFDATFDPMLNTSGVTILMRNVADAPLSNSLTVNGVGQSLTDVFNGSLGYTAGRMSYAVVPLGYNGIAGITISATFNKGSANSDNLQELFVIPGRWTAYWATAVTSGINPGTIPAVAANDMIFAIRMGNLDQFTDAGTFSGTSTVTRIMSRHSRWYTNSSSHTYAVTAPGNLSFTPGRFASTNSSGVTTYYDYYGMMVAFQCSQV